jgi:hypothetical protein
MKREKLSSLVSARLVLGRELDGWLRESRIVLGAYLNADPDDLIYILNATHDKGTQFGILLQ